MSAPIKNIKTGDIFYGLYMGSRFSGVVTGIEANQSGWESDCNRARISVRVDADLVTDGGWKRREAGDEIIISVTRVKGGYVRDDNGMYAELMYRRV